MAGVKGCNDAFWLALINRGELYVGESGKVFRKWPGRWVVNRHSCKRERVYRPEFWREMRGSVIGGGHRAVIFQGKRCAVARVVWMAAHGSVVPEGCELRHLNGDAGDCCLSNLELVRRRSGFVFERQEGEGQGGVKVP